MFNNMSIKLKTVGLSLLTWGVMMGAAVSCGHPTVATWILAGAGFVVALGGGLWLGSSLSGKLTEANSVVNAIIDERWDKNVNYQGRDEVGALIKSLNLLKSKWKVKWHNLQNSGTTNSRLQAALDSLSTNVMMADENFNIVYTNKSVVEMLRNAESDVRKDLPNFSAGNLIGANFDQFHKNPAHQRGMIGSLSQTFQKDIVVGGRTFGLVANPVFDQQNKRLGTVVEWRDKTEELARQAEIDKVAAENARVKQALDAVTANVMVADADNNIVYMNHALSGMLGAAQDDIRKDLPNFDARNLMGVNMDSFHKNPDHQRRMVRELKSTYEAQIVAGGRTFKLVANPVVGINGERLGTAVEWADRTEELRRQEEERVRMEQERKVAAENARVKQALDAVTTNVVVADDKFDIVYLNRAATDMLSKAQSDIRKELPNFDASNLVGVNMDSFHKNPAHQRRMAESLTSTYKTQIQIGGRTFSLVATPVFGNDGKKLGVTVEWNDRTAELAVEEEVSEIVSAAASGDLGRRINMEGKEGFFKSVSSGINQLTSICDNVIKDTVRVLGSMARGDLSQRITADYEGAFAQLKSDANETTSKFQEIITEIRNAADAVQSGASEISAGNQSLSQRTEEQASSLEETASSMEEMTSTIKQNADNANQANQLASSARSHAEQGGEVVNKAVTAMEEINNSSKKVADIIGVIDEIAFQTNLLALNAAVEAARAGEQGRGFAVVASEVRNLAQRSATAAKEIKELIQDSVSKVDEGGRLVDDTGKTLAEIVGAVKKVSDIIAEIAAASREQAAGIDQVNKAVMQLDEMTQQNAALVEEAAATSESLAGQAKSMSEQVGFFVLAEGEAASHSSAYQSEERRAPSRPVLAASSKPSASSSSSHGGSMPSPSTKTGTDDDEWEEF